MHQLVIALVKLIRQSETEPWAVELAKIMPTICARVKSFPPDAVMRYLNRIATTPTALVGKPQWRPTLKDDRVIFAALNPDLDTLERIAHRICSNANRVSQHWVNTYRSRMRPQGAKSTPRKVAEPINPHTGLYYHESPECPQAHSSSLLYIYHAQAWACGLYASELRRMCGGNPVDITCKFTHYSLNWFERVAVAPAPVLAFRHQKHTATSSRGVRHYAPFDNKSLPYSRDAWSHIINEHGAAIGLEPEDIEELERQLSYPMGAVIPKIWTAGEAKPPQPHVTDMPATLEELDAELAPTPRK